MVVDLLAAPAVLESIFDPKVPPVRSSSLVGSNLMECDRWEEEDEGDEKDWWRLEH